MGLDLLLLLLFLLHHLNFLMFLQLYFLYPQLRIFLYKILYIFLHLFFHLLVMLLYNNLNYLNYFVLFLLNSLLGLNTFTDAKDIYYSIIGLFPFLESDFLKNGMFIILWVVLSFSEVYIIKVYTNLFILRMNKNKMMK